MRRLLILFAAIVFAACTPGTAPTTGPTPGAAPTPRPPDKPAASPPAVTSPPTAEAGDSFTPGEVQYRVVNVYRDADGNETPLDVYVRTDGIVRAFPIQAGLAYGATTDYFAPPTGGSVVLTKAGAGDPTCVADCPHILVQSGTTTGEGNARTIIAAPTVMELWHDPDPSSVGVSGNALAPADPSVALIYTVAVALTNADFGLRLAFDGADGCQPNRAGESILVGGNQVGVFGFTEASVAVNLHDNRDAECTGEPVGGPFTVSGEQGSRTLLVLYGEPNSMDAAVLPIEAAPAP